MIITIPYLFNYHRDTTSNDYVLENMQYTVKDSESVTYESISLKEARLSTLQSTTHGQLPVQTATATEDNVNIEENPSYSPKPVVTEDITNMEENSSYLTLY